MTGAKRLLGSKSCQKQRYQRLQKDQEGRQTRVCPIPGSLQYL